MNSEHPEHEDFEDHIILYAKGWYGCSTNGIIYDLSVLLAKYSGLELEHISKNDIMGFIISTLVKTTSNRHYDLVDAIKGILIPLFPKDSPYHRNPEEVMIGKISCWKPDEAWKFTFDDLKAGKGLLDVSFKVKS